MKSYKHKRRVLIVDDSPFMRKLLTRTLESDERLEVVGIARNGVDALEKIANLKPNVVTLDIEMPKMDGLTTLKLIMQKNPTPVLMVSAMTKKGAEITFDCLEAGAVDFVVKEDSDDFVIREKHRKDLIRKVVYTSSVNVGQDITHADKISSSKEKTQNLKSLLSKSKISLPRHDPMNTSSFLAGENAIAIGTSTGGPKNLLKVIPKLPYDTKSSVFVVQHMPEFFTKPFANRLDSLSEIHVKEAENGETVKRGVVYLAKGGIHMHVLKNPVNNTVIIRLKKSPFEDHQHIPSVDVMMACVANTYRSGSIGVLMTGMGRDGVEGMKLIKEYGGRTIAESKSTAVIYGMPAVAVEEGCVDVQLPCYSIAKQIMEFLN